MQVWSASSPGHFSHRKIVGWMDLRASLGALEKIKIFLPLLVGTVIIITKCSRMRHWEPRHRAVTSGELPSTIWLQTSFISNGGNPTPNILIRLNHCSLFWFRLFNSVNNEFKWSDYKHCSDSTSQIIYAYFTVWSSLMFKCREFLAGGAHISFTHSFRIPVLGRRSASGS